MMRTEVLVSGGGPAGVAAAIAARRAGAEVCLVERYGFLGGTATAGMYGTLCGFFTTGPERIQVVKGIADELLAHLRQNKSLLGPVRRDGMVAFLFDPSGLKLVLDRMVLEAGVEVLLHSTVTGTKVKNGWISSVTATFKSSSMEIGAETFIDATGDADVAALAGVPYEHDPEALQAGSMMFKVSNVDVGRVLPLIVSGRLQRLIEEANRSGEYNIPMEDGVLIPQPASRDMVVGFSRIVVDGTDARSLTKAEFEGREQVRECFRFLTERVPGFERARLSEIACQVGIRETRRIRGEYVLTREDVLSGAKFADAIARCACPIEQHLVGTKLTKILALEGDDWYEIPYRCSLALGVENLLAAGRCISATAEAQASLRAFAPSMAVGQACGVAAAMCIKDRTAPRGLDIENLRTELRARGAFL